MTSVKKKSYKGAIIGLGGLGCPALICLVQSWKDHIPLNLDVYDGDEVELSNLNRQILFTENDTGTNKAEAGCNNISNFSSSTENIRIFPHSCYVTDKIISDNFTQYDFIMDCTDSVPVKISLNSHIMRKGGLLLYAGVEGYNGTTIVIHPGGPCLECIFGEFSSEEITTLGGTCQEAGIIGAAAGLLATLQTELLLSALANDCTLPSESTSGYVVCGSSIRLKLFQRNKSCRSCSGYSAENRLTDAGDKNT
jgi:molybdopterin/thiamine biosynthesis adenylyltransferase